MNKVIQITTTCDQREALERLAAQLIENRLAACVQIAGPIQSVYRWKGSIEKSDEWICTIKTFDRCSEEVVDTILNQHPYDVPEIITGEITGTHAAYHQWMCEQIKDADL